MAEDEDGRPGQPYKSNHASKTAIKWHMVLKWGNVWFEGWDWFNKEDEFNSVRYVGRGTVGGVGHPSHTESEFNIAELKHCRTRDKLSVCARDGAWSVL